MASDSVRIRRTTLDFYYSAFKEREVLCNDLNVANLALSESKNKVKRKNRVIEVLIGIAILQSTIIYFK